MLWGRAHEDVGHSSKWGGTVTGDTKTEAEGAGLAAIWDQRLLSREKAGRVSDLGVCLVHEEASMT